MGGAAYRRLPRSSHSACPGPRESESGGQGRPSIDPIREARETEAQVMGGAGWWALAWSFIASGSMTVSQQRPNSTLGFDTRGNTAD